MASVLGAIGARIVNGVRRYFPPPGQPGRMFLVEDEDGYYRPYIEQPGRTYEPLAKSLEGIPLVDDVDERDELFPSPEVDQRVQIRSTGSIYIFTASGWVQYSFSGEVEEPTPADTVTASVTSSPTSLTLQLPLSSGVTDDPPAYRPGTDDTLAQPDFDSYTALSDAFGAAPKLAARAGPVTLSSAGQGRGGTGRCLVFTYTTEAYGPIIEMQFAESQELAGEFWFKTNVGADPTWGDGSGNGPNFSGFKWLMIWRPVAFRQTWGVSNLGQNAPGNGFPARESTGNEFSTHDNTAPVGNPWEEDATGAQPNPFLQNVSTAASFRTCNDGNWHKWAFRAKTGPAGYEMIWVDDLLVLDSRIETTGIEIARSPEGFYLLQLMGTAVSAPPGDGMVISLDDIHIWRVN